VSFINVRLGIYLKSDIDMELHQIKENFVEFFISYYLKSGDSLGFFFNRVFIMIVFLRLVLDSYPKTYILVSYFFLGSIIYFNLFPVMSFISLFMICTKLLIYIEENSLPELKTSIYNS